MSDQEQRTSHLFMLRLWPEELGGDRREWRGQLIHVLSGDARYFRKWSGLITLLDERLPGTLTDLEENEEKL